MIRRLCSHPDIFKLIILSFYLTICSCEEPNLSLNDKEISLLKSFTNSKIQYANHEEDTVIFKFTKKIDTLIFDNRGIINSHYSKTYFLKSVNADLIIKIVKSQDHSSFIELNLFQNKGYFYLEDFNDVNSEITISNLETLGNKKIEYFTFNLTKGLTHFKFAEDKHPFNLESLVLY